MAEGSSVDIEIAAEIKENAQPVGLNITSEILKEDKENESLWESFQEDSIDQRAAKALNITSVKELFPKRPAKNTKLSRSRPQSRAEVLVGGIYTSMTTDLRRAACSVSPSPIRRRTSYGSYSVYSTNETSSPVSHLSSTPRKDRKNSCTDLNVDDKEKSRGETIQEISNLHLLPHDESISSEPELDLAFNQPVSTVNLISTIGKLHEGRNVPGRFGTPSSYASEQEMQLYFDSTPAPDTEQHSFSTNDSSLDIQKEFCLNAACPEEKFKNEVNSAKTANPQAKNPTFTNHNVYHASNHHADSTMSFGSAASLCEKFVKQLQTYSTVDSICNVDASTANRNLENKLQRFCLDKLNLTKCNGALEASGMRSLTKRRKKSSCKKADSKSTLCKMLKCASESFIDKDLSNAMMLNLTTPDIPKTPLKFDDLAPFDSFQKCLQEYKSCESSFQTNSESFSTDNSNVEPNPVYENSSFENLNTCQKNHLDKLHQVENVDNSGETNEPGKHSLEHQNKIVNANEYERILSSFQLKKYFLERKNLEDKELSLDLSSIANFKSEEHLYSNPDDFNLPPQNSSSPIYFEKNVEKNTVPTARRKLETEIVSKSKRSSQTIERQSPTFDVTTEMIKNVSTAGKTSNHHLGANEETLNQTTEKDFQLLEFKLLKEKNHITENTKVIYEFASSLADQVISDLFALQKEADAFSCSDSGTESGYCTTAESRFKNKERKVDLEINSDNFSIHSDVEASQLPPFNSQKNAQNHTEEAKFASTSPAPEKPDGYTEAEGNPNCSDEEPRVFDVKVSVLESRLKAYEEYTSQSSYLKKQQKSVEDFKNTNSIFVDEKKLQKEDAKSSLSPKNIQFEELTFDNIKAVCTTTLKEKSTLVNQYKFNPNKSNFNERTSHIIPDCQSPIKDNHFLSHVNSVNQVNEFLLNGSDEILNIPNNLSILNESHTESSSKEKRTNEAKITNRRSATPGLDKLESFQIPYDEIPLRGKNKFTASENAYEEDKEKQANTVTLSRTFKQEDCKHENPEHSTLAYYASPQLLLATKSNANKTVMNKEVRRPIFNPAENATANNRKSSDKREIVETKQPNSKNINDLTERTSDLFHVKNNYAKITLDKKPSLKTEAKTAKKDNIQYSFSEHETSTRYVSPHLLRNENKSFDYKIDSVHHKVSRLPLLNEEKLLTSCSDDPCGIEKLVSNKRADRKFVPSHNANQFAINFKCKYKDLDDQIDRILNSSSSPTRETPAHASLTNMEHSDSFSKNSALEKAGSRKVRFHERINKKENSKSVDKIYNSYLHQAKNEERSISQIKTPNQNVHLSTLNPKACERPLTDYLSKKSFEPSTLKDKGSESHDAIAKTLKFIKDNLNRDDECVKKLEQNILQSYQRLLEFDEDTNRSREQDESSSADFRDYRNCLAKELQLIQKERNNIQNRISEQINAKETVQRAGRKARRDLDFVKEKQRINLRSCGDHVDTPKFKSNQQSTQELRGQVSDLELLNKSNSRDFEKDLDIDSSRRDHRTFRGQSDRTLLDLKTDNTIMREKLDRMNEISAENLLLQSDASDYQAELNELRTEAKHLRSHCYELTEANRQCKAEIMDLRRYIDLLKANKTGDSRQDLLNKIEYYQMEHDRLMDEIRRLKSRLGEISPRSPRSPRHCASSPKPHASYPGASSRINSQTVKFSKSLERGRSPVSDAIAASTASSFAASRLQKDRSLSPSAALNIRDLTMDRYNHHMDGHESPQSMDSDSTELLLKPHVSDTRILPPVPSSVDPVVDGDNDDVDDGIACHRSGAKLSESFGSCRGLLRNASQENLGRSPAKRPCSPSYPGGFRSISPKMTSTQKNIPDTARDRYPTKVKKSPPRRAFAPRSPADLKLGYSIKFTRPGGRLSRGTVKYIGHLPTRDEIFIGVELDGYDGKHSGNFQGTKYFTCSTNKGIFTPFSKVIMAWE